MNTEELEIKFDEAFGKNTAPTGGGYEADFTSRQGLWNDLCPIITQFAKEYHIELLEAMEEVIRISDRKHDAWDRAKELIKLANQ